MDPCSEIKVILSLQIHNLYGNLYNDQCYYPIKVNNVCSLFWQLSNVNGQEVTKAIKLNRVAPIKSVLMAIPSDKCAHNIILDPCQSLGHLFQPTTNSEHVEYLSSEIQFL